MFFRLLLESFVRQRRRKALAGIAILLGTTAVTAMLALATTIGDRIHQELAVYGANIVITPKAANLDVKVGGVDIKPSNGGSYLKESDLDKLKTIFWANNITGISPELSKSFYVESIHFDTQVPVQAVVTGMWFSERFGNITTGAPQLHPWWHLQGKWPPKMPNGIYNGYSHAAVGSALAKKLGLHLGDYFYIGPNSEVDAHKMYRLAVDGIVTTGDGTDNQVLLPLSDAHQIYPYKYLLTKAYEDKSPTPELPSDSISRVEVSATTKPEDAFARVDPDTLSPAQREIWYCRPYANSIAYQIREAIPDADAQQVRRVEQSEGTVLARISGLMWLISAAALLAAGFAVSAAMATAVLERRHEIGLMRSLGASKGAIALLFYAETALLAIFAGTLGYLIGSGLAAWLGARIFAGESVAAGHILIPVLLPVIVGTALIVAIAGSTPSIRAALRLDPSAVLRADA